jgi:hypothetical protein
MSTSTQPRQPSGTPVGGQFAGKANPEASIDLVEYEPPLDDEIEPEHPSFQFPGDVITLWSPDGALTGWLPAGVRTLWGTGAGFRFFDSDGHPDGPVFKTADDGVRWARSHGWPSADPLTGEQLDNLEKAGLSSDDLWSPTRDRRMAARSRVGDLVFYDPDTGMTELLSNAYVLANHAAGADQWRVFCHEDAVTVAGRVVAWRELSAGAQLDYIRGYAMEVTGVAYIADQGPFFEAGWSRGVSVSRAAALIDSGVPFEAQVTIVDPDAAFARRLLVDHVEPDPDNPLVYRAQVAAGQYRRHQTPTGGSRTVPWAVGTPIRFPVDAIAMP